MALIIGIIIILLLVLLGWTWHNLGTIENKTKIICIVSGLVIVYIITFIIFSISKVGINYENKEILKLVQTILVILFTIVNGYILLPYIFKKLEQIDNDEIEKEKLVKGIVILLVLFIFIAIFEVSYLGSIQNGILDMINRR